MLTIIALPEGATEDIIDYTGQVITDLSPIWLLVVGVLLGGLVLTMVIDAFKK